MHAKVERVNAITSGFALLRAQHRAVDFRFEDIHASASAHGIDNRDIDAISVVRAPYAQESNGPSSAYNLWHKLLK